MQKAGSVQVACENLISCQDIKCEHDLPRLLGHELVVVATY